jgi:hypothetical protein
VRGIRNAADTDSFEFGAGVTLPAEGFLVLSPVAPELFRGLYTVPSQAIVLGPFSGGLANEGERLTLLKPVLDDTEVEYVAMDHVRYNDRTPWPVEADGQGPSLERFEAGAYGNEPLNWIASLVDGGTPGFNNSVSSGGPNVPPEAIFRIVNTAPLDFTMDASQSFDPDGRIVSYEWDLGDGSTGSGEVFPHVYQSGGEFTVTLTVTDNRGAKDISVKSLFVVAPPLGGGQIPGDSNQDGILDISDPIQLLTFLFIGGDDPIPCEGSLTQGGNKQLLDLNTDDQVDLSDAIFTLSFLFLDGAPPGLGTECLLIPGCPEICTP